MNLAPYLDLANHHANSTPQDIRNLCDQVIKYGFNSAFVNPCYVAFVRENFGQKLKVGTVISFPLGQDVLDLKVAAARRALLDGADELDVSLNIGLFKLDLSAQLDQSSQSSRSLSEMRALVEVTKSFGSEKIVKFIIETGFLSPGEVRQASQLVLSSGADFVKTCSGIGPRGASLEDVRLIKRAIGDQLRIKVAGGVETYDQAVAFINAGASRIGTSHAVQVITQTPPSQTHLPNTSE